VEQLVEAGGAQFYIQVADASGPATIADRDAALSLSGVRAAITGVASELAAAWKQVRPSEATVEFGVTVVAKTGRLAALVVEGGGEATLRVTLTWRGDDHPGASPDPAGETGA
jgi:hypothetical protein